MSKFDGNYPLTWIFEIEKFFEPMMRKLRNQEIMEYLIKWNNLPTKYSAWTDSFIHKRQQLIKHWEQRVFEGEGHVKL